MVDVVQLVNKITVKIVGLYSFNWANVVQNQPFCPLFCSSKLSSKKSSAQFFKATEDFASATFSEAYLHWPIFGLQGCGSTVNRGNGGSCWKRNVLRVIPSYGINTVLGESPPSKWKQYVGHYCLTITKSNQSKLLSRGISLHYKCDKVGCDYECSGHNSYKVLRQKIHANFTIVESELVLNPEWPHLGASPDDKVQCDCCGKGILEIKTIIMQLTV